MKTTELRIGNLIQTSGDWGAWSEQREVCASDFGKTAAGTLLLESFSGIKLTEEWLVKFGFTPIDLNEGLAKEHVIILRPDFNDSPEYHGWYYVFCEDYMQRTVILKTVHQLQNLYYALTNEELKLPAK